MLIRHYRGQYSYIAKLAVLSGIASCKVVSSRTRSFTIGVCSALASVATLNLKSVILYNNNYCPMPAITVIRLNLSQSG